MHAIIHDIADVRAILAMLSMSALIAGVFVRLPMESLIVLDGLASAAAGYYFGARNGSK